MWIQSLIGNFQEWIFFLFIETLLLLLFISICNIIEATLLIHLQKMRESYQMSFFFLYNDMTLKYPSLKLATCLPFIYFYTQRPLHRKRQQLPLDSCWSLQWNISTSAYIQYTIVKLLKQFHQNICYCLFVCLENHSLNNMNILKQINVQTEN